MYNMCMLHLPYMRLYGQEQLFSICKASYPHRATKLCTKSTANHSTSHRKSHCIHKAFMYKSTKSAQAAVNAAA